MSVKAIILAAGKGTRMKSDIPKVMHRVNGIAMLEKIMNTLMEVGISSHHLMTVLGDKKEYILQHLPQVNYSIQEEQFGTGHAVKIAKSFYEDFSGSVIITYGDAPLIEAQTYQKLIEIHERSQSAMTVVTTQLFNPFGYGRIIKNTQGNVVKVVEERDATEKERQIQEINTGLYCIRANMLAHYIEKIENNNSKSEYYLTDLVELMSQAGELVSTLSIDDFSQMVGVNDKVQLAQVSEVLRKKKNKQLMESGVILIDPDHTYIEEGVEIGQDSVIYPNVFITGKSKIGCHCTLLEGSRIESSTLGDRVVIKSSYVEQSIIESDSDVGPYAHLRPLSHLKERVHVGNFVEIKKATLSQGVKVGHLSYIGDATVGEKTNIGCGTITCNYDGKSKHQTIIGKECFIGSDTKLIAPVTVGDFVLTAAGSVVSKDVPDSSLAIERSTLVIKEGYFKK